MRLAVVLTALALAGCRNEPDFDERYAKAQRELAEKSAAMDRELSVTASEAASPEAVR